jgi:alkaline phosphatase D
MKRREFLQNTGWFVVGASLLGIPGCDDNKTTAADAAPPPDPEAKGTYSFPHGVASGDPRAGSVVLWTRAVRGSDAAAAVTLKVQVAGDPGFAKIYAERLVSATAASDHTVRVLVTQLASGTAYYYRFVAGQDEIAGQTRTAPDAGADVQVNLAWVSCQDYAAGHYGAYRQLMVDDDARPAADKIHAIVHLGDMIYETRANGFQTAIDDNFQPIALTNRDGSPRAVAAFPSGGGTRAGATFAATLDDYRHLYKTFLTDPDLQAARARWPFISVWDDHEFTDDCWQSQANYTGTASLDETDQTRRVAASQAWFEYVPVQLSGAEGVVGVASQAKDFTPVTVKDAAFTAANDDNFVAEDNNAKAVGAITIYRSFRFGKHVELVMTDQRSYRSDHAIPEDLIAAAPPGTFFAPRNALPLPIVNIFDQGKTANGGNPPPTVAGLPNLRAASPPGTMLGKAQKAWWKATMKGSDATWKLWGSEVTLMRMRIQAVGTTLPVDLVISADAWDGYPTERVELMTFLKDQGVKNVVTLSGDIHASFAGVIMDDFDAASPTPVACELVAAGISSNSLFSFFEAATRGLPPAQATLRNIITVDATAASGAAFTENFNLLLLDGTVAAATYAATKDIQMALAVATPANPHLKYADTNAQGYGYAKITASEIKATIVTINRPIATPNTANPAPGVKRTASFTIPKNNPAGMTSPVFTGTKPFPLDKL